MSNLAADMGTAIHRILKAPSVLPRFRDQFRPQERDTASLVRNLNAAFLIALTGKRLSHPAKGYLTSMSEDDQFKDTARFYLESLGRIDKELAEPANENLAAAARDLVRYLDTCPKMNTPRTMESYWALFFPEGIGLQEDRHGAVRSLREKRSVRIRKLNQDPIAKPHEEILLTSNVLLTVPLVEDIESLSLGPGMKKALKAADCEDQAYWYDHPVPVGIETSRNEAVYGLRALDQALQFEIDRGNAPAQAQAPVLLSISTTHYGLQALAHEYLALDLQKAGGIDHLRIYAAAEKDTIALLDTVLIPASARYFPERDTFALAEVLGVDGEYGRHYSFLKAVSALWQVLIDSRIRATFKFDLDQAFPQEELVSETGRSAFEHLCDPLWGAEGTDSIGRDVELGMLAGALVNEGDIKKGLFTPDITWPVNMPDPDHLIFASRWPQALSTEAEMMTRYGDGGVDGESSCLQRFHVTGGTTGILVDHLRRHRPFTPGWIGRAEDQAYLLPVLHADAKPTLRYAHAAGFIMRHDKETFASQAMEAARIGKMVGDHVRILNFTSCARALPWEVEDIKGAVDPFTGCFISPLPATVACLRMALTAAAMFASDTEAGSQDGVQLVRVGSERLGAAMRELGDVELVRGRLDREREGWDLYYDVLDALEKGLEEGDGFAISMKDKARELVEGWKIECAGRGAQGAEDQQ